MFEPNEIVLLLMGIVTCGFVFSSPSLPKNKRRVRILVLAFCFELGAWIFTNLENILWPEFINILEHGCEFSASFLLLVFTLYLFPRPIKH